MQHVDNDHLVSPVWLQLAFVQHVVQHQAVFMKCLYDLCLSLASSSTHLLTKTPNFSAAECHHSFGCSFPDVLLTPMACLDWFVTNACDQYSSAKPAVRLLN